ncbi:MAG: hypothetical protein BGP05_10165 [Rhizobiales bacterium 62-47]|nr:alcohol dehydrogenase catalytic domain-containing protein [Hyphomicrobiales bacterium]OJY14216.1 MAG: hypothetical protein BGP05_10165 [Rhizobiales bacterium 62-47]
MFCYEVTEHGAPLQRRERPTPAPVGREVVIRMTHCGLCHSDVHLWKGFHDLGGENKALIRDRGIVPPLTLGHEPLGIVSAIGPDVRSVKVGDKRLVYPWLGCGQCWACDEDLPLLCVTPKAIGVTRAGGYSTHLLVPDERYLVDTDGIDDAFAATLACSGVTSYSAVRKVLSRTHRGDSVAVIGCGGLGLLAISILRASGHREIIACDVDQGKLDAAIQQGASESLRADQPGAIDRLRDLAGSRLAGVIDFVGRPETFAASFAAIRRGGVYVLVGLHGGALTFPMPPIAQRYVSIEGSYVGTQEELRAVVSLAREGKLQAPPIRQRTPEQITDVLRELDRNAGVGRNVVTFPFVQTGR